MSKARIYNKHRGAISELRACSYLLERGYEVFRNVSSHGSIDLIGIKDGEIHYFDVKTIGLKVDGMPHPPTLTPEQHRMGVRPLAVLPDGSIRSDIKPARCAEKMPCVKCGEMFIPLKSLQRFCTKACRTTLPAHSQSELMPLSHIASLSCSPERD